MTEYKDRYRGLKAAMGDKDKQLDLAKRTIERLSGQCNAIEVTCHSCCQTHMSALLSLFWAMHSVVKSSPLGLCWDDDHGEELLESVFLASTALVPATATSHYKVAYWSEPVTALLQCTP